MIPRKVPARAGSLAAVLQCTMHAAVVLGGLATAVALPAAALTPALVRDLGIATQRFRGQLVVLTDEACFSACLDFLDLLLLVPGAVHVGRSTGADTRYMDVGYFRIAPQVVVQVPRKVWLGRSRGDNESYVPVRTFDGDIGDDAAVRRWVLETMGRR